MAKIETVADQDKFLIQNSIKYLDSLTKVQELNVPTLKSLYRTKCKLLELRRHIYLPREKPNYRCQRCFMNFAEGPTKYEVRPMKLSNFAKKVLGKMKNNRVLTMFQKIYYKKLKKRFPYGFEKQNKMVITCNFCKKESEIWMKKPAKILISKKTLVTSGKRKKKSKKDMFCGLQQNVVSEVKNNEILKANSTFSKTNTRDFETADFIPLKSVEKDDSKIKRSKQIIDNTWLQMQTISKSTQKSQEKSLRSLANILRGAKGKKEKQSVKLKQFLADL